MEKEVGTHRMDKPVIDKIKAMAKKDHRSYNSMFGVIVTAGLKALEAKK